MAGEIARKKERNPRAKTRYQAWGVDAELDERGLDSNEEAEQRPLLTKSGSGGIREV